MGIIARHQSFRNRLVQCPSLLSAFLEKSSMSPCCPVGSSDKLASAKNWHFIAFKLLLCIFQNFADCPGDDVTTMVEVSLTWSTIPSTLLPLSGCSHVSWDSTFGRIQFVKLFPCRRPWPSISQAITHSQMITVCAQVVVWTFPFMPLFALCTPTSCSLCWNLNSFSLSSFHMFVLNLFVLMGIYSVIDIIFLSFFLFLSLFLFRATSSLLRRRWALCLFQFLFVFFV